VDKSKKKGPTNQMQARYLRSRLEAAQRTHNQAIWELGKEKPPAAVLKARNIVDAWTQKTYKKQQDAQSKAKDRLKRDVDKALQTMLFGEPAAALKAVEFIEQKSYAV
jgi:hypothetical protein